MFIQGFEKCAGLGGSIAKTVMHPSRTIGTAVGKTEKAVSRGIKGVKEFVKERRRGFVRGYREGVASTEGKKKPEAGETLFRSQMRKLKSNARRKTPREFKHAPELQPKDRPVLTGDRELAKNRALERIQARKQKIKEKSRGPSFAAKHPLLTGGAGLLAGKMIFDTKKEEADPQIVYPQY